MSRSVQDTILSQASSQPSIDEKFWGVVVTFGEGITNGHTEIDQPALMGYEVRDSREIGFPLENSQPQKFSTTRVLTS